MCVCVCGVCVCVCVVCVCVCVCGVCVHDGMPITVHEHSTWIDIMLYIIMCLLLLLGVTCSGLSTSCATIFLTGKHTNLTHMAPHIPRYGTWICVSLQAKDTGCH